MTIAGVRHRLRAGLHLHSRRVPAGDRAARSTRSRRRARAGLLGDDIMGARRALRHRDPPRRRRVHLRRGDGALQLDRGLARRAAQQAAVPGRRRPVRQADGASTTSRRSSNVLDDRARAAARRSPRIGTAESTGTQALLPVAATSRGPGVYEVPFGTTLRELIELAGGVPRRPRRCRRCCSAARPASSSRPTSSTCRSRFEGTRADRRHARLGRRDGVRRHASTSRDIRRAHRRVLPRRIVRPVRALPRRHGAPGGAACTASPRGGRSAASREELALLDEIGQAMRDASICGLGQTASQRGRVRDHASSAVVAGAIDR